MKIVITPQVESEVEESVDYYEACRRGLGDQFLAEFEAATKRIFVFPEAWPLLSKKKRRCLLNRFPFCIIYSVEDDCLLILALMHLKRKPLLY